ncbi:hypothetical protein [Burkholderia humptydooensis]|uniref:hypothetical protein n=1 Tax=Burkholderia humptydooensis TaxID=430531 RepID=UPI0018AD50D5|nr:hypothetical protein [Burkholderia humptydooensis]
MDARAPGLISLIARDATKPRIAHAEQPPRGLAAPCKKRAARRPLPNSQIFLRTEGNKQLCAKQCSETPDADSEGFVQSSILGRGLPPAGIRATAGGSGTARHGTARHGAASRRRVANGEALRAGRRACKIVYHRVSSGRHARSRNLFGDRKEDSC